MKVLVTGASGFVGWHSARALADAGHRVRVLVRDPERARPALDRLAIDPADRVPGDMGDPDAVGRALEGCDAVLHAAASVQVAGGRAGDGGALAANAHGARHVLGGACERGLDPVLFVSSLTVVFDPHATSIHAGSPLVRQASGYTRSKVESERVARELQERGAPVAIVYPPGVVGPDDPGFSESVRAYRGFLRTTLRAGATQLLDVRDLAELHRRWIERGGAGRCIAGGHFLTWDALTALLEEVSGARISRLGAPGFVLRTMGSLADVVGRWGGPRLPLTREGMESATRWRPIDDSPEVAALGIVWRDPRETLEDLLRWYVSSGRLPAEAVPRLVAASPSV